jgi:sugar phosphate isomerase/epimerase
MPSRLKQWCPARVSWPRLSVLARLFEPGQTPRGDIVGPPMTFEQMLGHSRQTGVTAVGLYYSLLADDDPAARRQTLADAGVRVSYLTCAPLMDPTRPETWPTNDRRLAEVISIAGTYGVNCIHGTAGGRYPLEWDEAAAAFCRGIATSAKLARESGCVLSIEPTNLYTVDISFLQTLADTVEVAEWADVGVNIDLNHCGTERNLE